jgi:hypothetical protein
MAREPRLDVHSVRLRFPPHFRDKRIRDAVREQRLERGKLGTISPLQREHAIGGKPEKF